MSNCIIHIGMHKTGSSSIQDSLYFGLNDKNFTYVSINNNSNQSSALLWAFLEKPLQSQLDRRKILSNQEIRDLQDLNLTRLQKYFKETPAETFILSGESVSIFDEKALLKLRTFMSETVDDFYFVGYIRSPKSLMESAFQQKLKVAPVNFDMNLFFPRYEKLKKFDDIFGREKVKLWKFDPTAFTDADVVMDFCGRIGVEFNRSKSIRANEGLSLPALKLLYCYRKFFPVIENSRHTIPQNNHLIKILTMLSGEKIKFHSSLIVPILEKKRTEIDWIEKRIDASLSEVLTNDDACAIRSETDLLDVDDTTSHWLAKQLGPQYESMWQKNMAPQQIAEWVHVLYKRCLDHILENKNIKAQKIVAENVHANVQKTNNFVKLKEKNLSDFELKNDIEELLEEKKDAIYVSGKNIIKRKKYLNDLAKSGYILSLENPKLIPQRFLVREPQEELLPATMPNLLLARSDANLLVTQHNEIFSDSFLRNRVINKSLTWSSEGEWQAPEIQISEVIESPCFFVDFFPLHFGHALLELPARLWPLLAFPNVDFKTFLFVGYPTHGLRADAESWPTWLKQFVEALGLPLDRFRLIRNPTLCRRLILPERISPLEGEGGPLYNQVMQKAGDRLLALSNKSSNYGDKIFLSRSRLTKTDENQKRSLGTEGDEDLDHLFSSLGFSIVHTQELSLPDQVAVVRGAKYIAGCVGSQLHLTAFCNQEQFYVLRISPSFFSMKTDAVIARATGAVFYDYVFQRDLIEGASRNKAPWTISKDEMRDLHQFIESWSGSQEF